MRILVIGPLPPPIGGTRVSMRLLLEGLARREDVEVRVISVPPVRRRPVRGALAFAGQLWRALRWSGRSDVVTLHLNPTALPVYGPAISAIARLRRTPWLIRTFGGVCFLDEFGPLRRAICRAVLRAAQMYLAQTHQQVRMARDRGVGCVAWYPTSRPMAALPAPDAGQSGPCRRFVYVGHVRHAKGIPEIIAAAEALSDDVTVDVFGPFRAGTTRAIFDGCRKVRYGGELSPDQVIATLWRYDALLMPTRLETEGYPGVILEAYCAGVPVIATRCGAIPEIVDESCGLLTAPGDAAGLRRAMTRLMSDEALYRRLRQGVRQKRELFDLERWVEQFVRYCRQIASEHSRPGIPRGRGIDAR